METEVVRIFDENYKPTGVAPRSAVHRNGYWHETFHCWFIRRQAGQIVVYFQLRSQEKKDFPNMLDITAAGHLLADETVEDGIREVEEELGITTTFANLVPVGMIKDELEVGELNDRELCHVYIFDYKQELADFVLQEEEVAGMVTAPLPAMRAMFLDGEETIEVNGYKVVEGVKQPYQAVVSKEDFVPHNRVYYEQLIRKMESMTI